jgi:ribosomal protein L12E/L44/L45/RPP1/RPP2
LHIPLLNIAPEGKLQREIKDILDELGILIYLVKQQKEVIEQFQKNVREILKTDMEEEEGGPSGSSQDSTPSEQEKQKEEKEKEEKEKKKALHKEREKEREKQLKRFNLLSDELLQELGRHLRELESLKDSAASTSVSVSDVPSIYPVEWC